MKAKLTSPCLVCPLKPSTNPVSTFPAPWRDKSGLIRPVRLNRFDDGFVSSTSAAGCWCNQRIGCFVRPCSVCPQNRRGWRACMATGSPSSTCEASRRARAPLLTGSPSNLLAGRGFNQPLAQQLPSSDRN